VGEVKKDRGVVDKPIGRTRSDPRKRHAGRGVVGKERDAVTEYKVLKRFETSEGKFTYLEIHPKTGRTHQIRVHMKFLNHPVACDPLYNPKGACPEGLSRMALHAKSIEFKNVDGEMIKIEASVPEEFEKILQKTLSLP
jgi:23S rRNA pseudouridine1911/1915/1917 synthase